MRCYNHPGSEAVGGCVSCGQLVCRECKVLLGGKIYCNACAERLVQGALVDQSRSWFERHLNWTVVLAWLSLGLVSIIVFASAEAFDPFMLSPLTSLGYILIYVVFTISFVAEAWYLVNKNRSLWWILMPNVVPFGGIVFLCLQNRSQIQGEVPQG